MVIPVLTKNSTQTSTATNSSRIIPVITKSATSSTKTKTTKITPIKVTPVKPNLVQQAQDTIQNVVKGVNFILKPKLIAPIPQKDIVKSTPQKPISITPNQTKLTQPQMQQVGIAPVGVKSVKVDAKKLKEQADATKKVQSVINKIPNALIDTFLSNTKNYAKFVINTPSTLQNIKKVGEKDPKAAEALAIKFLKENKNLNDRTKLEVMSFLVPFGKAGFLGSKFIIPGGVMSLMQSMADEASPKQTAINVALGAGGAGLLQGGGKILSKTVSRVLESLPKGEVEPQKVIGAVIKAGVEKTPEGKAIVKAATEAEKQGKNIVVDVPPPIESSVVQKVSPTGEKTFQTIPKGQLEEFKAKIDNSGGTVVKDAQGNTVHLTAKTPEQMTAQGFKENGVAKINEIPKPVANAGLYDTKTGENIVFRAQSKEATSQWHTPTIDKRTGLPKTIGGYEGIPVSSDLGYVSREFASKYNSGSEVRAFSIDPKAKVLSNPEEIKRLAGVGKPEVKYFDLNTGLPTSTAKFGEAGTIRNASKEFSVDDPTLYRNAKKAGYDVVDLRKLGAQYNIVGLKPINESELRVLNPDMMKPLGGNINGKFKSTQDFLKSRVAQPTISDVKPITKLTSKAEEPVVKTEAKIPTSEKVVEKEVSVPREQLPVSSKEGIEKASRLEARVTQSLDKTPQEIKDQLGSTFTQMNKKENIAKAVKYVIDNPEDAMKILRGEIEAPKDILKNSIYVAMENMARGDVALARRLASLSSTRAGQELSILTEIDKNSPVRLLRDIVKVREANLQKQYAQRSINDVKNNFIKKAKIQPPKVSDWGNIIKEVRC